MPKKQAEGSMSKGDKSSAKKSAVRAADRKARKPAISASTRANLIMPIQRVLNLMRRDRLNVRVSKSAGIMMASMLEYLAGELCEMAGNLALEKKKKRLTNRFLLLAV